MIQENYLKNDRYNYLLKCGTNFLNMLSEGIYIRREERIIFCNPEASKIFSGSADKNLTGSLINDLVTPTEEYGNIYKDFLKNSEIMEELPPTFLRMKRVSDDKIFDLEVCGRKVLYNESSVFMGIMKDLSDIILADNYRKQYERSKKMLEEAREYDRVKTEFFENLSHELRTPLNVILGIVQLQDHLMKNESLEKIKESCRKYNEILKQNCFRLVRMVNNVLDMTKIDSGYLKLNLKNENLVSIVENITMSVVEYAASLGVNIVFDTDVEEKIMAFDSDNMERIVLNLLSNAVKFTPEGKCIYVTVLDKGDKVNISIRDEGEGIPPEKQQFIFNRFIQADNSYRKKRTGTGIGLSLVKSLVELHGGTIELISEMGRGSEFIITLPVCAVEENANEGSFMSGGKGNVERVSIEFSDIYNVDIS
ncbi:MAG: HAMP domain-containing sensor histidine kinase [Bacillota bacterium]|nr:HAMP domain-containing sensor histidine kinase [Bacillota bacterium]